MQLNGEAPMAAIPSPRLRWGGLGWGAPMTRTERDRSDRRTKISRRLRREATPFERRLWLRLKLVDLPQGHFRRQAPIGPYFADFAHHGLRLVIEIDGEQHGYEAGLSRDSARTAYLELNGYRVLRFWNNDIRDNLDGVMETILHAAAEPPTPSPSPPQAGGGEVPHLRRDDIDGAHSC